MKTVHSDGKWQLHVVHLGQIIWENEGCQMVSGLASCEDILSAQYVNSQARS